MIGVIEKFLSVKRLDGFVLCIQSWRKTSSSKFLAAWKCLRIVNKGRTFSYKYFLDFEEKYGKISDFRTFSYFKTVSGCRTFSHFISETSATLTACVIILICCFAQQPHPLFRAQAPLRGQETSTDPWSYLTRMANFNQKNWCINENVVDQHFHLPRNARKDFRVPLQHQPTPKRLMPRNLLKSMDSSDSIPD